MFGKTRKEEKSEEDEEKDILRRESLVFDVVFLSVSLGFGILVVLFGVAYILYGSDIYRLHWLVPYGWFLGGSRVVLIIVGILVVGLGYGILQGVYEMLLGLVVIYINDLQLSGDKDSRVRQVDALEYIGADSRAVEALTCALKDEDGQVRNATKEALEKIEAKKS